MALAHESPDDVISSLTDKELLEACIVSTFRSGGKGGQHLNKTDSAVRLYHRDTGITVISRRERSQHLNKIRCLQQLRHRLEKHFKVQPPRIPTRIPALERQKRSIQKSRQSIKKNRRKKPDSVDG